MKEGVPVPLLFRIATVLDKKHITKDHKTRELWKSRAAHVRTHIPTHPVLSVLLPLLPVPPPARAFILGLVLD